MRQEHQKRHARNEATICPSEKPVEEFGNENGYDAGNRLKVHVLYRQN